MRHILIPILALALTAISHAELRLPNVLSSHMVLQRDVPVSIWGWADTKQEVQVAFAGQSKTTTADKDGRWHLKLDALATSATGRSLTVKAGTETLTLEDILVGEVWLCSGQSNMEWRLAQTHDAKLEIAAANYPLIRHCKFPHITSDKPNEDIDTSWTLCSKDTAADYTAVGYFFGRNLHQVLQIPIGLVNDSWGGTPAESWTRPGAIEAVESLEPLMTRWQERIDAYDADKAEEAYEKAKTAWEEKRDAAKEDDKPFGIRAPRKATDPARHQSRPGNIYHGMISPITNLTFRGAIWYQGESNQSRAYQYRTLFPTMISCWRDDFDNGDFPFYFVQIANFKGKNDEPMDSSWAEVREAQDMTLDKLPKTGQAVIIDIGAANNIHPVNKQDVGARLARLALKNDYGQNIIAESPRYKSMEIKGNKIILTLESETNLIAFDRQQPAGFTIAAEDKTFVNAKAKISGKTIEVWSDEVKAPVAARYSWADNPDGNIYNTEGLPTSPFRTDDWPGITVDAF